MKTHQRRAEYPVHMAQAEALLMMGEDEQAYARARDTCSLLLEGLRQLDAAHGAHGPA